MTRVIERTLTPEREAELRRKPGHYCVHEILPVLDALRAELEKTRAELEACNDKLRSATANGILLSEQHEALRAAERPGRDAVQRSRYTLHAVQRERAAHAWQAMQCWLLMCCLLHESKVGFVLKYRKLYPLLWGNRKP